MNSRLLEHRVCRQTCAWVRCLVCFRSSKCSSCLQQQMQGLDSHKHLMPYLGLRDASLLLKVRLPVRMLLSGSCISSDAVKPKFPLTPSMGEQKSCPPQQPEGLVSSGGSIPSFRVLSRAGKQQRRCSSHAGRCFFL